MIFMLTSLSSPLSTSRVIQQRLIRSVRLLTACALLSLGATSFGAEPSPAPLLWSTVPAVSPSEQPPPPKKPSILRERDIAFDERLVSTLKDAAARPLPPIAVELFDTDRYELDVLSTLARNNDTSFVRGQLKPQDSGEFLIVLNGAAVTGTIHLGRRLFKIEPLGNGRHRLIEIDPEQESKE
ncbi:exported hypothetical protein [Nitrospira lenta]|uniref:Type II secretion system protein GspC N-terminal domain-containing protein n=2 Tax=Nitrospira lenta TaxID=1436998 RepID=A0A330L6T3_9BACT|nr:exported hypothetical protein [Nitrospira lenta]